MLEGQCHLTSVPLEILHHIAVDLAKMTPIGPPLQLVPLMQTCSALNARISPIHNANLFGAIYRHKLDSAAVERRLGRATGVQWAAWGTRAFEAMRLFRRGDVRCDDDVLLDALCVGVMVMLDDDGKNAGQMLLWARADVFVQRVMMSRLYERSEETQGWPRETPLIAYTLQLMWLLTSEESLLSEPETTRAHVQQLLLPFVYCPFRYPSTPYPPNHYIVPPLLPSPQLAPTTIPTAHGPYPLYPPSLAIPVHLPTGQHIHLAPPPPALLAKLLYVSREEVRPLPIPPHLHRTRADREAAGISAVGPVREDIEEANWSYVARPPLGTGLRTREGVWKIHPIPNRERAYPTRPQGMIFPGFEPQIPIPRWVGKAPLWDDESKSAKWDMDFARMRAWADIDAGVARKAFDGGVYDLGTADGLWVGRLLIPVLETQQALASNPLHPADGALTVESLHGYHQISFMRMREIHGVHGEVVPIPPPLPSVSADEDEDDDEDDDEEEEEEEPYALGPLTAHDGMNNAWFLSRPRILPSSHPSIVQLKVEGTSTYGTYRASTASSGAGARLGNDAPPPSKEPSPSTYPHDKTTCPRCKADSTFFQTIRSTASPSSPIHSLLSPSSPCTGVREIVILGSTDPTHGAAFHHWELEGRVRPADGLFLGLRRPKDGVGEGMGMGTMLFWGYFVGRDTVVGNWRVGGTDVGLPAWEGTFVWGRRGD